MRVTTAALALCCLIMLPACGQAFLVSAPPVAYEPPEDGQFSSIDELSEHMDYYVKSLYTLPAGYIESGWECVGGAAVTAYSSNSEGGRIFFYMWDNTQPSEHFFDTVDYTQEVWCSVGGATVSAFGSDGVLRLCQWSDEVYSYVLYMEIGVEQGIFQMILDGVT